MLEQAGFSIEAVEPYVKHRSLTSLTDGVCEENVKKIRKTLNDLTGRQREAFNVIEEDGQLYLNNWFVLVSATV